MKIIWRFLAILAVVTGFFYLQFPRAPEITWGLNFSIPQARYLQLDWKKLYQDMLTDFQPKRLRLMAYWEIGEPQKGQFNFADFDYLLDEAAKHEAKVILVLGRKQPRWPECHEPEWVRNQKLNVKNQKLLEYIKTTVERYKNNPAVYAWQVENEPFFNYGPKECTTIPRHLLRQELDLVRSLDSRPIILTDSGEKGAWLPTAWFAGGGDIFGSTMYRKIYHHKKQRYIEYPIPPALYRIKAGLVRTFSRVNRFAGVELQAEPWFASDVYQTAWEEQKKLMNPRIFQEYADYARRVGFAENYFWGVEWWYWAKRNGHPEMWEAGKKLITNNK